MPNFTPSFQGFKKLVQSIPDQSIALQLKQLLSQVKHQTVEEVQAGVEEFIALVSNPEVMQKITESGKTAEIFASLEELYSNFAACIQKDNPALAASLKNVLNMKHDSNKNKEARMKALARQLVNKQFIAAFSAYLKSHLTPTYLNREEHIEAVMDEAAKTIGSDNNNRASQAIYDPERDFIRQLFRLLFTITKLVSHESMRSAKPTQGDREQSQIRFLPPIPR